MITTVASIIRGLSPMQSVVLHYAVSAPKSGLYIVQITGNLPRDVDLEIFERAWAHVVERHAILRTGFERESGGVWQFIEPHAHCPLRLHDWRGLPAREQGEALQRFLGADRTTGFDLRTPPLMRLSVLRLADEDRVFIWTYHHLLLDSRARFNLLTEVGRLYEAYGSARAVELPPPRAFADYVTWVGEQDLDAARSFWTAQLGSRFAPRRLAIPHRRSAGSGTGVGSQKVRLSPTFRSALLSVAHRHKVTVNLLVQAAWAILQAQDSGSPEVVFGVTRSGRRIPFDRAASVVGLLINSLPHRLDASPDKPGATLLEELRRQHLALRSHQHASVPQIRAWCGAPPDVLLFDSIINFQDEEIDYGLREAGCDLWREGLSKTCHTPYPLKISGFMRPDLVLDISYDRDAFDDDTIEQVAWQLVHLLKAMLAGMDRTVGQLLRDSKPRRVWTRAFRSVHLGASMPSEVAQYTSRIDDDAKVWDVPTC